MFTSIMIRHCHGGELRDILHLYSDRRDRNIRHFFFNTQRIFTVKRRYFIAFSSKPLSKRCFYGRCIFPFNLEQRLRVDVRGCVENYSALHKTSQYSFSLTKTRYLHFTA